VGAQEYRESKGAHRVNWNRPERAEQVGPEPGSGTVSLTLAEIQFCHAWFAGESAGNATRSYERAGFPPAASPDALRVAASELLSKPHISAYLAKLAEDACEAEMVTSCGIVRGFKRGAEADIADIVGPDGFVLPLAEWPDSVRLAVCRFECEELFENRPDPVGGDKKVNVLVGHKWKVWLENKTECRKTLAVIKRMIGSDVETPQQAHQPLVVKGADPDLL
jgi:hypothetical protein